tara:strand:+ start:24 stop:368 length:345 start_codon:yes stop_codon:yes gene_type:complete
VSVAVIVHGLRLGRQRASRGGKRRTLKYSPSVAGEEKELHGRDSYWWSFYTPNFLEPDRHAHESMLSLLTSVKAALWDEAPAEQRKLTMQLGRNSLYFATAVFFIKQFGEQVAV